MPNTRTRRRGNRYRSSLYRVRFLEDLRDFPDAPSMLSEGDSWFGYPIGKDLNDHIAELGSFNIRHFQKAGDELVEDMMGAEQLAKITKALKTFQFDVMIYSGGGNDIVAENLTNYILDDDSGIGPYGRINEATTLARIDELKNKYLELVSIVNTHQKSCPIVVHGYDKIIPSDKGFELAGFKLAGPWVKPTLDEKGVPIEQQADVINHIMDMFNDMLADLQDSNRDFHYVDLRGTLTSISSWANEIHPTSSGFKKLAQHYDSVLRQIVPRGF